jgi:hypothetical protein
VDNRPDIWLSSIIISKVFKIHNIRGVLFFLRTFFCNFFEFLFLVYSYFASCLMAYLGNSALMLVTEILGSLLNMVTFDSVPNTWSLARPILSISVSFPQCLAQYQKALSSCQSQQAQQLLPEAFQGLMGLITPYATDVSNQSKEQFVVGLNKFVGLVGKTCVRPLW